LARQGVDADIELWPELDAEQKDVNALDLDFVEVQSVGHDCGTLPPSD